MDPLTLQVLATVGALGAAVFAAVSSWLSHKGISSSRQSTEAGLVARLLEFFWSPAFSDACRELHRRKTELGEAYAREYKQLYDSRASLSDELGVPFSRWDTARRVVKGYFRSIQQMADERYLSKRAVRKVLCPPHRCRDLLFGLVYPLESESGREMEVFDYFSDKSV